MKRSYTLLILCFSLHSFVSLFAQAPANRITCSVQIQDSQTKEKLSFAFVELINDNSTYRGVTSDDGSVQFPGMKKGKYKLVSSLLGYQKQETNITLFCDTFLVQNLSSRVNTLKEVVVTASESKGITSASKIDLTAMEHLQPSSFTDLLELLPGGMSKDPNMGSINTIKLRETGKKSSDYDISSLGTSFVVDGVPIGTDANMQYISGASQTDADENRKNIGKGVDMRTISTDNIESVEIVRGIPSVEYGNLTSGLVKINRKLRPTALEARFKADEFGKLFSIGKGVTLPKKTVVNVGLDYLDSKIDPRNNFENYKRITASLRARKDWDKQDYKLVWQSSLDYSGLFDTEKVDPDISYQKIDKYKSGYNRIAVGNTFSWKFPNKQFVKALELNTSFSLQLDKTEQTKFVSLSRDVPIASSTEAGEHDGLYLPYKYTANILVDGKPLNAYVKAKGDFFFKLFGFRNNLKSGLEWTLDKNLGRGQVYDVTRPVNTGLSTRPRRYKDIPAGENVSFFAEDELKIHSLTIVGGLRAMSLLNLDKKYAMSGKVYLDPRVNAQWSLPAVAIGEHVLISSLSGGIGWHTKTPTLLNLYPDKAYYDIVQLNYYHTNPDYKRLNLQTYIADPTNYDLKPAVNKKWEVRGDISYNDNRLSVTYFREKMNSGFRSFNYYQPYAYKKYDTSTINAATLQGPPQLSDLNYTNETVLRGYSTTTNGSRLLKEGIEFQFASRRMDNIKTRVTINGAWFKSTYSNSQPVFYEVSSVVNNVQVSDKYVGLYAWTDGSVNQQFNTNFIFDTYLQSLGLKFSTDIQCMWFTRSKTFLKNGTPVSYMDVSGNLHPYTEADQTDKYLQWLKQKFSTTKSSEPFFGYINFKATKELGKSLQLAFFVNKILDYSPDYLSNGITVRRNQSPYFGMELNIKL